MTPDFFPAPMERGPKVMVTFNCHCCHEPIQVEIDTLHAKHKITDPTPRPRFSDRMELVDWFKVLKGYDKIPTWNSSFLGRHLKVAGSILHFLRKTPDAVKLGKELIFDTHQQARRDGWHWEFSTCHKRISEWWVGKTKEARNDDEDGR